MAKNYLCLIFFIVFFSFKIATSQVFIPMGFWRPPSVVLFGAYRAWSDNTYAISCDAYLNPVNQIYKYIGNIGDGIYRIQPASFFYSFDVYCDMTNDSGGWMLAAVPRRATAKMSEVTGLLDPTITTATRNSEIWVTTSTVPFRNIRFTNNWPTPTSRNIATFATDQTFNGLLTTYATYSNSNVILSGASIISNIASTCFIIRGKSGTNAPYTDAIDWLWMGFHSRCTTPLTDADNWDTNSGATQWVVGGKDQNDGMLANTSVGINTGNRHWNFDNSGTYNVDTRTIVWIK